MASSVVCNSSGVTASMAPGMEKVLTDIVEGGKGIALTHAGLQYVLKDLEPEAE